MVLQLGLIGYPITHSLSPWIHKQFLNRANIKGEYKLINCHPYDSFSEHVSYLKKMNIDGFNVTVPYKEKIVPYLDSIDTDAKVMGAVNTVLANGREWVGFNTDGKGYLRSLIEQFPNITKNKTVPILIIGAGGAAKGIYYTLLTSGFLHIDITNRTLANAEEITKFKDAKTQTACFPIEKAEKLLGNYSIIIQTTSVGMKPDNHKSIISLDNLRQSTIVSDIVYQPLMTTFLKKAQDKGASIHLGHTMLLYQAQLAFEIWTGHLSNLEGMDTKLQMKLEVK